jgi:hypothetical protein
MSTIRAWRSGRVTREPTENQRTGTSPLIATTSGAWRAELELLAQRLAALSPSWKDPEHFASERSELVRALRRLARDGGGV